MPPEAMALKDYLKGNGILSFAAFPLMRGKFLMPPSAFPPFEAVSRGRLILLRLCPLLPISLVALWNAKRRKRRPA